MTPCIWILHIQPSKNYIPSSANHVISLFNIIQVTLQRIYTTCTLIALRISISPVSYNIALSDTAEQTKSERGTLIESAEPTNYDVQVRNTHTQHFTRICVGHIC